MKILFHIFRTSNKRVINKMEKTKKDCCTKEYCYMKKRKSRTKPRLPVNITRTVCEDTRAVC